MKKTATVAVIVILSVLLASFGFLHLKKNRTAHHDVAASPSSLQRPVSQQMPSAQIPTSPIKQASGPEAAKVSATPPLTFARNDITQRRAAEADPQLLSVKQMLRDYRAALGENPVGTNSEITKALLGANSRKAKFVEAETKLNAAHQLLDRWNHPYFFHQLSRTRMEIRSAGPDGVMWTSDDELSP